MDRVYCTYWPRLRESGERSKNNQSQETEKEHRPSPYPAQLSVHPMLMLFVSNPDTTKNIAQVVLTTDLSLIPLAKRLLRARPMDIAEMRAEFIVSVVLSFFSNVVKRYGRISKKSPSAAALSCGCKYNSCIFQFFGLTFVKTLRIATNHEVENKEYMKTIIF